jgi:hypothetical protein
VPSGTCPFTNAQQALFENGIQMLFDSADLPEGYGVTPAELGDDGFEEHEEIGIGLKRKGYSIHLPSQIWQPRTELWAKGLYAMNTILSSRH